jgi:predicted SprT family Zn-dependent metalloprotease
MDIQRAVMIAKHCMKYHGLLDRGWRFGLDNAKTRMGVCMIWCRVITISEPLALLNSEDEVLDTILHEIAHALAPAGSHHGPQWKWMARQVGAKPERCAGKDVVAVPTDWTAHCNDCGKVINRSRRPKDSMMRTAYHTSCKHKMENGRLTWKHKGIVVQCTTTGYTRSNRTFVPYGTIDATAATV